MAERVELSTDDDRGVAEHDEEPPPLVPCRREDGRSATRDAEHEGESPEQDAHHVGDLDHYPSRVKVIET